MNEKKFLDEINLRIKAAKEGHAQAFDKPDNNSPMLWKAKVRGLEDALKAYMEFGNEPEGFVSNARYRISWISEQESAARVRGDHVSADYWLAKWGALMNVMALYEECAAEPDDPPAPKKETFVGQLEAGIELTNKRYEEALHYWNYHQAATLQVRRDTLKDVLAMYKRFAAEPQNDSAISK